MIPTPPKGRKGQMEMFLIRFVLLGLADTGDAMRKKETRARRRKGEEEGGFGGIPISREVLSGKLVHNWLSRNPSSHK